MSDIGTYLDDIERKLEELRDLVWKLDEESYTQGYDAGKKVARWEADNERPTQQP